MHESEKSETHCALSSCPSRPSHLCNDTDCSVLQDVDVKCFPELWCAACWLTCKAFFIFSCSLHYCKSSSYIIMGNRCLSACVCVFDLSPCVLRRGTLFLLCAEPAVWCSALWSSSHHRSCIIRTPAPQTWLFLRSQITFIWRPKFARMLKHPQWVWLCWWGKKTLVINSSLHHSLNIFLSEAFKPSNTCETCV